MRTPRTRRALRALTALALALPAGLALTAWRSGAPVWVELPHDRIGLLIHHWSGEQEPLLEPGTYWVWPFFQELRQFTKKPLQFHMQGVDEGGAPLRLLSVRSSDGSGFWFDSIEVHYRLDPQRIDAYLRSSGAIDPEVWLATHAPAILREELGRYAAREIADVEIAQAAKLASLERLNAALLPHGLRVDQIVTPKPQFDREYEKAIEDRKVLEQEAERLEGELAQAETLRNAALDKVRAQMQLELEALRQEYALRRVQAESKEVDTRADAERYTLTRAEAANAERSKLLSQAEVLRLEGTAEADALATRVASLETLGELAIREKVIELLSGVQVELTPYSEDPRPSRVEVVSLAR
jgi:hypothetical protein